MKEITYRRRDQHSEMKILEILRFCVFTHHRHFSLCIHMRNCPCKRGCDLDEDVVAEDLAGFLGDLAGDEEEGEIEIVARAGGRVLRCGIDERGRNVA